jgi:hypothetical protein
MGERHSRRHRRQGHVHRGRQVPEDTDGNGSVDTYRGTEGRSFLVSRTADGDYTFYDWAGEKRIAGYNYLTCI